MIVRCRDVVMPILIWSVSESSASPLHVSDIPSSFPTKGIPPINPSIFHFRVLCIFYPLLALSEWLHVDGWIDDLPHSRLTLLCRCRNSKNSPMMFQPTNPPSKKQTPTLMTPTQATTTVTTTTATTAAKPSPQEAVSVSTLAVKKRLAKPCPNSVSSKSPESLESP